ncbi:MAG: hypothetical protein PHH49_02550 [Candidatus Omnitrophica bacterium]|nr:hypothetical protein [Candidatus Omnitrophota bacterium]MDD5487828.1 hypothetical protein [Candidatus Omnitrophota bacterium]
MKKIIIVTVISILAVVMVFAIAKDVLVKVAVERGVELVTGLRLRVDSFRVGILNTKVDIDGLRLFNPKGFADKVMLDMPDIYVDYDLPAITKGTIHLYDMRIYLKEFTVVKNEKGELNLDSLKVVQQKGGAREPAGAKGKLPAMQIDSLHLKIGRVLYKDYSGGGKPKVQEFPLNLDEKYSNINDPNKLVSLIVVKAIMNTTIARLTNFDIGPLKGIISDTLATAQKLTGQTVAVATETLSKTTEQAQGMVKGATGTITETTKELTNVIKLPFGSKKE